jgi:transcriptional regulator with XRE-family HTH domain
MDLRAVFGANLRRLRHARELSQEELAYAADVNRTYMSKLESGTRYVGLEVIGKLAKALEVEPAELLKLPPKRRAKPRSSQQALVARGKPMLE